MIISNITLVLIISTLAGAFFFYRPNWCIRVGKALHMEHIFLFVIAMLLFLVSGFRGDFTQDYANYHYLFHYMYERIPFGKVLFQEEQGFVLLNKIVYLFSQRTVAIFLVVSAITVFFYYKVIKKESVNYVVSIIILITFDNYIISFNLMRNILAVAMFLYAASYIWEGKPIKYIFWIIFISTMHRSAILMLPMYWVLRFDYGKRKNLVVTLGLLGLFGLFWMRFEQIVFFIQRVLGYQYDITLYGTGRGSLGSLLKSSVLFLFVIILIQKINFKEIKERVWFNACVYNMIFQVFSVKMFMMQRIGFYFSGFFMLLIPLLFKRNRSKSKWCYILGLCCFAVLYAALFRKDTGYYTFLHYKVVW